MNINEGESNQELRILQYLNPRDFMQKNKNKLNKWTEEEEKEEEEKEGRNEVSNVFVTAEMKSF